MKAISGVYFCNRNLMIFRKVMICLYFFIIKYGASPVVQSVKNLPVMQETQVQFLGREDAPEKEMVTHSSILAWKFHGQRSLAGYDCMGLQRVRHD